MRIVDIFTVGYSGDRGDDHHGRDFGRDFRRDFGRDFGRGFDRRDRDYGYGGRYR